MIEPLITPADTLITHGVPLGADGGEDDRGTETTHVLTDYLQIPVTARERRAIRALEAARPTPQRPFDQISMIGEDLIRQTKLVAPLLADREVVFVGDLDGTSLLLGALGALGTPLPARMLIVDFDERLLRAAESFAREHGFADRLAVRPYNVFDPPPPDLIGRFDWFYTNPPYGRYNGGASAQLFIARGCEMTRPDIASGCLILPYDTERAWTRRASWSTEGFLHRGGWATRTKIDGLHRYDLDDDSSLTSSMTLVDRVVDGADSDVWMTYHGRVVPPDEIPHFYGRSIKPPYPRYIRADGTHDLAWPQREGTAA